MGWAIDCDRCLLCQPGSVRARSAKRRNTLRPGPSEMYPNWQALVFGSVSESRSGVAILEPESVRTAPDLVISSVPGMIVA